MRIRWTSLALALGVMSLTVTAVEAAPKHKKKPTHKVTKAVKPVVTGAENTLVGVTLFDSGRHVIDLYGTPDTVQSANISMTSTGGGAGAGPTGGAGFPGGGGGMPRGGGGKAGAAGGSAADFTGPDDFGNEVLRQGGPPPGYGGPGGPPPGVPSGAGGGGYPGGGYPGGPGGARGPGAGRPGGYPGGGAPGVPGGAGIPGSGGGQADNVVYTRWSYERGSSRYGFVLDKFNRVVQIEAIGIDNPKVHTKRGIGFGNNFASLIKTYGPPDGYDIAGDSSLTVRYLTRSKVAFRLTRMAPKKPVVVTGIVIAAAKG